MSENEAGETAWAHLMGAHTLALRAIEERLKAAGMPPLSWYDVLLELDRAGGRLRIGSLAERLVVEPYNVTRLLDRLEKSGLLIRERVPSDRRGAFAVITDDGQAMRQRIWPEYRRAIADIFAAPLTDREAEQVSAALGKVIARLRAR